MTATAANVAYIDASSATLRNYVGGQWVDAHPNGTQEVRNPATDEPLATVPLSGAADVDAAVQAAEAAFPAWRATPPAERARYFFRLRQLLEEHREELARMIVTEMGKTLDDARGEVQRGIDNVETACGIPNLMMGYGLEDGAARGIDEEVVFQPLGVCAAITPFNFPFMIAFWFWPYAVGCGNTYIIKPSEQDPIVMHRVFELIEQAGFPPGVMNLVNGGKDAVNALCDHPRIAAISFVGSTRTAAYVYGRASAAGKRVQASGGAKNPIVVMPDADMEMSVKLIMDSAFGCAGQRCLAASIAVPIGEARKTFTPVLLEAAASRKVGFGLDPDVEMGPVITAQSRERIEGLVERGLQEGGKVLVDGRKAQVQGYEQGHFVKPTVIELATPASELASTEIFGPVLSLSNADTLDDAIAAVNASSFGNMACIFTSSGAAARKFRYEARVGNVGVNIGTPAPMAFFPFSGWKGSFFGDLHAQGKDAIEFYTDKKIVVERWPKEWSRQF